MSKADEMFEKIGYKLEDKKICPHSYKYIKKWKFSVKEIVIEKASKSIDICYYHIETDGKISPILCIEHYLKFEELQAIIEKCKELRMDGRIVYERNKI